MMEQLCPESILKWSSILSKHGYVMQSPDMLVSCDSAHIDNFMLMFELFNLGLDLGS